MLRYHVHLTVFSQNWIVAVRVIRQNWMVAVQTTSMALTFEFRSTQRLSQFKLLSSFITENDFEITCSIFLNSFPNYYFSVQEQKMFIGKGMFGFEIKIVKRPSTWK